MFFFSFQNAIGSFSRYTNKSLTFVRYFGKGNKLFSPAQGLAYLGSGFAFGQYHEP